jgi:hypothetical protein
MITALLVVSNIVTAVVALEMYLQNRMFKNGLVRDMMDKMR